MQRYDCLRGDAMIPDVRGDYVLYEDVVELLSEAGLDIAEVRRQNGSSVYHPNSSPAKENVMAAFLSEYELPDWLRKDLEDTWQRISAPQAKQLLWERKLSQFPALGASLIDALRNRDIVACWIVAHKPHPTPPMAIIDMGLAADCLDPKLAGEMKQHLPDECKQPFQVPAGQEI